MLLAVPNGNASCCASHRASSVSIGLGVAVLLTAMSPRDAGAQPKMMLAMPAADAIALDGRLEEPAWGIAPMISDFAQRAPKEGAPPADRTEVRLLYTDDALVVGARMWDAPNATRQVLTRRDELTGTERLTISLDPYRTRRIAYSFSLTVAGVRADWIHTDDSEDAQDPSWNPVWSAATMVLPDGWSAEMRIPWSQLRYPPGDVTPWGINVSRHVLDRNEDVFWIVVPRDQPGWSSHMGELRGLADLPRHPGVEVVPYASASVRSSAPPQPATSTAGVWGGAARNDPRRGEQRAGPSEDLGGCQAVGSGRARRRRHLARSPARCE